MDPEAARIPLLGLSTPTQAHDTPMEGMKPLPNSSHSEDLPAPVVCVQELPDGNYERKYQSEQTKYMELLTVSSRWMSGLRSCAPLLRKRMKMNKEVQNRKWWKDWRALFAMGFVLVALKVTIGLMTFKDMAESSVASELEAAGGVGVSPPKGRAGDSWKDVLDDISRSRRVKRADDEYEHPLLSGEGGAVTSDVEQCSVIGIQLLKDGGNAVDAAIGTAICIGTINMAASGVGGGGFAVIRLANGTARSFNFREMAPQAAHRDMFVGKRPPLKPLPIPPLDDICLLLLILSSLENPDLARFGGLAFAIPGEVHGFWTIHKKYGKLPWKKLWTPSIILSRTGFPVSEFMAMAIQIYKEHFRQNRDEWDFLFSEETGDLLVEGERMKRPQYAKTLKAISQKRGLRTFYKGYIAKRLVKAAHRSGGIITMDDFRRYFTDENDVLTTQAFNTTFITCPPPCSGPALIMALNIANGLDLQNPMNSVTTHRIVETMKWMSAGRTNLGDPTDDVFDHERVKEIMSTDYAAAVRKNISDSTTFPTAHYNPSYENPESKGTSHISVLDKAGNAVGLTTTVNLAWGNRMHDTHTGIILNSQMDDFSIPGKPNSFGLYPSIYNFVKPLKRPLSSIVPTIAIELDGEPGMIVGASGGSKILTGVFETIVKHYWWKYDLLDVVRGPRVHHQLLPDVANVENGISKRIIRGLRRRHHNVTLVESTGSAVGAITRAGDGMIFAVADWWRKGAHAAVY